MVQSKTPPNEVIRATALVGFKGLVTELGGDVRNIYERQDFDPDILQKPEAEIALETFASMLEEAAVETGIKTFGLAFGNRFDPHNFGTLGYLMEASETIADGIGNFGKYFPILQSNSDISVSVSGELAKISYNVFGGTVEELAQDAEFSLAVLNGFCKRTTPDRWFCRRVEFQHPAPATPDRHFQDVFGCEVHFSHPENAIFCDAHLIMSPVPRHDKRLFGLLLDHATSVLNTTTQANDLVDQLRVYLRLSQRSGIPTDVDAASKEMAVSKRSLQRRLAEAGYSFRSLKLEVTMEEATRLLQSGNPNIEAISEALGYSETSAFSRAFRQYHGKPPSAFT